MTERSRVLHRARLARNPHSTPLPAPRERGGTDPAAPLRCAAAWRAGVAGVVALAMFVGGCAPSGGGGGKAPEAPRKDPSLALDPCADQLHEIAGMMLEYYVAKRQLPATLAELKAVDPTRPGLFVCPTSGMPYVYNPKGVEVPARGGEPIGKLVLYDAVPAHRGMRWGIAVQERSAGQQLVTKVVAVPGDVGARGATTGPAKTPWE